MTNQTNEKLRGMGWSSLPISLKALFVLEVLWLLGSLMNLPNLYASGLPLLGAFVYGLPALAVPLLLDIIGPLVLFLALWKRLPWTPYWGLAYMGAFVVNSLAAFFTVREQLGAAPILVPAIVSLVFLALLFWNREYFTKTDG